MVTCLLNHVPEEAATARFRASPASFKSIHLSTTYPRRPRLRGRRRTTAARGRIHTEAAEARHGPVNPSFTWPARSCPVCGRSVRPMPHHKAPGGPLHRASDYTEIHCSVAPQGLLARRASLAATFCPSTGGPRLQGLTGAASRTRASLTRRRRLRTRAGRVQARLSMMAAIRAEGASGPARSPPLSLFEGLLGALSPRAQGLALSL